MEIRLTDYIPNINDIPSDKMLDVITRLRTIIAAEWPDIDTNPNSVVGDLIIKPLAYLIAAFEIGTGRVFSDLDLANVSMGEVYNCDFVKNYLKNLGIHERMAVPVIGTVRLAFNENKEYILDRGSRILFNQDLVFNFLAPYTGQITIGPVGSVTKEGNWKSLVQVDENEYVADLTVVGPAASEVEADDEALTDIEDPELMYIRALGDFTPGVIPEDITELAALASKLFHSATLTTRNGTVSFIYRQFPNVISVSPVMSGDEEMQRDKSNILGISEGRVDVLIRSLKTLLTETINVTLMKDGSQLRGKLNLPQIPLYIDSISSNNMLLEDYKIVGKTVDTDRAINLSGSYSNLELLGLVVNDDLTTEPATKTANIDIIQAGDAVLSLSGDYTGYLFIPNFRRNIELTLGTPDVDTITATALDTISGEEIEFEMDYNDGTDVATLSSWSDKTKEFFNGLTLTINSASLHNNEKFIFEFKAETASVQVVYRYDRMIGEVEDVISSPDIQSVVDILTKGFTTCYVNNITVNYRRPPGKFVDREKAKDEIYNYVNSLGYPEIYEQSAIADILLYAGATGIQTITETGTIYPTVATHYSFDGSDNELNFTEINTVSVSPLLDESNFPVNLKNYNSFTHLRNINYILDRENITLKEIKY